MSAIKELVILAPRLAHDMNTWNYEHVKLAIQALKEYKWLRRNEKRALAALEQQKFAWDLEHYKVWLRTMPPEHVPHFLATWYAVIEDLEEAKRCADLLRSKALGRPSSRPSGC